VRGVAPTRSSAGRRPWRSISGRPPPATRCYSSRSRR
jgi:hypothetical protein